jgi:hypothetical protein
MMLACHREPPKLTPPAPPAGQELLPDSRLEWLVIGEGGEGGEGDFRRPALLGEFDEPWRREHDLVRIYGWKAGRAVIVPEDHGDDGEHYEKVALGMRLLTAASDDDLRIVGSPHLALFRDDVSARLKKIGAVNVKVPAAPEEGAAASKKLQALFMANGSEVALRLLSPDQKPFPGPRVLEVLQALGMKPGDGELEFAGFEVKTLTPPGKLAAGPLAQGKLNPTSLLFVAYLPHVARPTETLQLMIQAQAYARDRLGGRAEVEIETFGKHQPADVATARKRAAEVEKSLADAGFPAGSPSARRLFRLP